MQSQYNPTRHLYLKEMIAQRQAELDEAVRLEKEEARKREPHMTLSKD